ncbi:MAG TPA: metallophosphoesterase [Nocardioidaceae bacterium]|nr:metallophosphoesterase [Nocardioidaceae bacterium]
MSFFTPALARRVAAGLVCLGATAAYSITPPAEAQTVGAKRSSSPEPGPSSAGLSSAGTGSTSRAFTFAAAGDLGANAATAASLAALDRSTSSFFLALGDLDYDQTSSDQAWCDYVKDRLPGKGAGFPFELLVGNHEEDGGTDGLITNFTDCLPDRLGSTIGPGSVYGAEYSFGYPAGDPLAQFIMIAPKLTVEGERHTYGPGSPHRAWLVRQIRRAREAGTRWIIVGAHYPCLTTGPRHGCDSGPAVFNLLLKKRVDVMLGGHNHMYERSKQLRLNKSDCTRVRPGIFDADCVVDNGADGVYQKGRGTVLVTAGSFGRTEVRADVDDSERRYFAKVGATTPGFAQFTVTRRRIRETFVRTSGTTLRDTFDILER